MGIYTKKRPIKIYKAFQAYKTYLDQFYIKNTLIKGLDFDNQLHAFKQDFFPWILSWSKFNIDQEVEIFETINDAYFLQKSWLEERKLDEQNWRIKAVIEQIRVIQPDVCIIYPPEIYNKEILDEIRSVVKHDILIGGYDGMNRLNISMYDGYDFVLTCSKYISDFYQRNNKWTYALEFGFDPNVNNYLKSSIKQYPVTFNGSIFPNVHSNRFELLSDLLLKVPITISSDFENQVNYSLLSKRTFKAILRCNRQYFKSYLLKNKNIGAKYGLEMYQFLKDSKITLNMHGENIFFAANVRLFEATGVGTCLLTDWKENIDQIFIPEKEVVTYTTIEEAKDKIRFLLRHDSICRNIALKGQKKTLENYTYDKRIAGVIQYVKSLI